MLLNYKQGHKNVNEFVPTDFQDGVNDFDVGVDESIFFSLYAEWRIWMPKSVIGGFHAISGDTNNNGEMNKCWWTNKAS